ncbi:MAG TPA: cell division protein SepF [Bacillota bacterium]|nr:cell division protein SepF [Bacillota bacterium]
MTKMMDKVLGFMGLADEDDDLLDEAVIEEASYEDSSRRKKPAVVSLHQQKQMKVIVMEPKVYEDVQVIADHLKNRRAVVVNLEHVEKDLSRRVVDFVSGAIYALNGSLQRVGVGIYLFVPSNVDISSVVAHDEAKEKGMFTWVR